MGLEFESNAKINKAEFLGAVNRVGRAKLAAAFKTSTFIYGTTGNGSIAGHFVKEASRCAQGSEANIYDPGRRVYEYIKDNYQMMDLYYGQRGTQLHTHRIPAIAEFVHYAMMFSGGFDMSTSGREAYMRTFHTNREGWDGSEQAKKRYEGRYNGLTVTQEMSRIIRWGVHEFGGKLIFEGRDVFYSQVFDRNAARIGDTDLEAIELFKYFKPGQSIAKFGDGLIEFHWGGKPEVPTQNHFVDNWKWSLGRTHSWKNHGYKDIDKANLRGIWNNFIKYEANPKNDLRRSLLHYANEKREEQHIIQ
ncbi:hypothetical protein M9194_07315 [Vibrio sp. S4M6]|uniref:hypothetical protein n=1 Tax=Vibrio sinus TaxID=2946865 RepID=UPI00202A3940|nr:hypothetical protein [Vibrio sinus]MCL9781235.1 hypothetical protein [Vibrio sinus]